MSIHAYVGLPRSGKTYNAVANTIIPALRAGRIVVTNIPLHMDRILELFPLADVRPFPINEIAQEPGRIFDYVPHGCVLVMDEVWRLFPAGLKAHQVPTEFKQLLAEHGHMVDEHGNAMTITLVTQDLAQISAFARLLVEQTFLHTKLSHLGSDGSFRVRIFHGPVTGQNPPKSNEIRMILGRYDEKIYRLYKSHTMSKAGEDGANEKPMDTRGNVWKRPGILAAAVAAVAVTWWSLAALGDIFTPDREEVEPASRERSDRLPAQPLRTARVRTPTPKTYRVAAIFGYANGENSYALLTDDQGESFWIPADRCEQSRLMWRCKHDGQWWPLTGKRRPPVEDRRATMADVMPSFSSGRSSP